MKRISWPMVVGAVLLLGGLFFLQGMTITGGMDVDADGAVYVFTHANFPPLLLGLALAAALWLLKLRGQERTLLEWIPALAVGAGLFLLTGAPLLGGRYPDARPILSLLSYTLFGTAVLDAIEAASKRRVRGFRPGAALLPALALLVTFAAPLLLQLYAARPAAVGAPDGKRVLLDGLLYVVVHVACLATGLALLPFARPRSGAARWAAVAVGAAYVLLYLVFLLTDHAPRLPWFSACFDWPANLCLPAGLLLTGLIPVRKAKNNA